MVVATKPMRLWAFCAQVLPRWFHKKSPACFMIQAEEGAGYSAQEKLLFHRKKWCPESDSNQFPCCFIRYQNQ